MSCSLFIQPGSLHSCKSVKVSGRSSSSNPTSRPITSPLFDNLGTTAINNNLNLQCFELLVKVYAKSFLWDHQKTIHSCALKDYQLAHYCNELQVYSSVRVDVFKFQPVIFKVCWLCRCLLECFPDRLRDTHPWPDFLLICLPLLEPDTFKIVPQSSPSLVSDTLKIIPWSSPQSSCAAGAHDELSLRTIPEIMFEKCHWPSFFI